MVLDAVYVRKLSVFYGYILSFLSWILIFLVFIFSYEGWLLNI